MDRFPINLRLKLLFRFKKVSYSTEQFKSKFLKELSSEGCVNLSNRENIFKDRITVVYN